MEFFWCFIAALLAGIGTGLAGLSAATVMVPIMIVLCPTFAGEVGAYHATAIALASDVLGSAFTAGVYIKHKNIDLKHSWIMLVCIITMCIIGSYVAYYVGNVVLGSFSLILCIGIGIRFLLKPDTQRNVTIEDKTRFNWKEILISIFFGLTIGFGTGFVGSGGGMMMLVVFTAFLGMSRKKAVGTSTFIMTFTALIAFVSHSIIDSTIIFADWPILVLCIITETCASIIAAQFANKVNNRIVGLVTGAVLTILGITMLCIKYWQNIVTSSIPLAVLQCLGWYLLFIIGILIIILVLRYCFKMPSEVARKILQFPAMLSVIFMLIVSNDWIVTIICAVIFCIMVYPILCILEKWENYSTLFMERRRGEVKKSLLFLFGTHIILVAICCGIFNKAYIVITSILVWGVADTAAALVGKKFGKHHISFKYADSNKTWEGTIAMALTSFITGAIVLLLVSPLTWWQCIIFSLVACPFSAISELYSHNGNDTISVPLAVAVVLTILSFL
ncbi:MAG: TSUP family transporter [Bacilli bacterium]